MPEGLSPAEVGKGIAEHKERAAADKGEGRDDRRLSILEALLLSLVAVLAAYSGYAAAKWGTESSRMPGSSWNFDGDPRLTVRR